MVGSSLINNCFNTSVIVAQFNCGGIAGLAADTSYYNECVIINCRNYGRITYPGSSIYQQIGGQDTPLDNMIRCQYADVNITGGSGTAYAQVNTTWGEGAIIAGSVDIGDSLILDITADHNGINCGDISVSSALSIDSFTPATNGDFSGTMHSDGFLHITYTASYGVFNILLQLQNIVIRAKSEPRYEINGMSITFTGLDDVYDIFIAGGVYTSYSDMKHNRGDNFSMRYGPAKLDGVDSYTVNLEYEGTYTLIMRSDTKEELCISRDIRDERPDPAASAQVKTITISNITGADYVFVAAGVYNNLRDLKAGSYISKGAIKLAGLDSVDIAVPDFGSYTVMVKRDGVTSVMHVEVTDTVNHVTLTGTGTGLDVNNITPDVKVVRYAPGTGLTTSRELRAAPGYSVILAKHMTAGEPFSRTLAAGVYSYVVEHTNGTRDNGTFTVGA